MEEVTIFWFVFLMIAIVAGLAHLTIIKLARGSEDQRLMMPANWVEDAPRQAGLHGQEEGVVNRMPPEAHLPC